MPKTVKTPFMLFNPFRYGGARAVAALELGDGYLCLEYQLGISQVVLFAVKKQDFSERYRYDTASDVKVYLADLKTLALDRGATLEAIQLLGTLMSLTKTEEAIMAEKLSKKTDPKTADKEGLKAAAKEAPVGGKKAAKAAPAKAEAKEAPAKKKGNPEALAKARAARADAGPDNRKIVVAAEHKKGNPYREGTKAAATFELIKKSKTVQEVKDAATGDHDLGYLRYGSRDGYFTLG